MQVSKKSADLQGVLTLDGSKSISNRAIVMLALAGAQPLDWLSAVSGSKDTQTLLGMFDGSQRQVYDAGDAGTVFRFMTAYLCLQPGTQTLTGSHRMQERPVGALVTALHELGADIQFLGRENYPPLQIGDAPIRGGRVSIDSGISSQFLSALLMVAPYFEEGLLLEPQGRLVSRPYLDMTVRLMQYFGAQVAWEGASVSVAPDGYTPRKLQVEADWSAASYWYSMVGLATEADITLHGLFPESLQGDAVLATMGQHFGIETRFVAQGIQLIKAKNGRSSTDAVLALHFRDCPDIAQSIAVLCAGLGQEAIFTGLETLSIKETDRIVALQQELAKVGVSFECQNPEAPAYERSYRLTGKAKWESEPIFSTYGDHRMAMAFAPLGLLAPVQLEHPKVVEKSYPQFWEHLSAMGFSLLAFPH
ncbi:MAG: 3-phosphoshikimate 1-carboxyvinyltransferase [Lewinellaceae bacterium]|nr:3-phosphoshikimate 1-carboxyvinyltransferase [Lewinellaceae bacterium]